MINILYPVCKSDSAEYKYFAPFLNQLSDRLAESNINLTYLLFSRHFIDDIKSNIAILGEDCPNENRSISEIENEYDFSFKEILYADLLQTSEFVFKTRDRNWYIPEKEFIEKDIYKNKLNQIAGLFRNNKYSFVFTDQTPDFEQSFIQCVCNKINIPFIRYLPNFMNRGFFMLYSREGKGEIVDADINAIDKNAILSFINNFRNGEKTTIYNINENNLKTYEPMMKKQPLWIRLIKKKPKNILFSSEIRLKDFYINKVEKVIKSFYYDNYDSNINYIYYGLHLTTESHIALESYPYINQINVIESISRALPFGYTLYVKPHPWWAHTIGLNSIKQIKKIPSVKVIHPTIPIKTILNNSQGIVTLNATTGVEALVLGKPVVALSLTNSYTQFHPNAELCNNLYDLPRMISRMVKTKVDDNDTIKYLSKMFSYSSDIRLESDRFLSVDDAEKKALEFAKYIEIVINKYSMDLK